MKDKRFRFYAKMKINNKSKQHKKSTKNKQNVEKK